MYQPQRSSRSCFVTLRQHRYHVRTWGNADSRLPPLVLLHGWMDVAASYQFMVDALTPAFFGQRLIVAPDWRGFGQTTGPACDHYVFADYLGDLDALLEAQAGSRPVDLVGHSMGGNVAMMYAGVRPARVRHVVNLEGLGVPDPGPAGAPLRYRRWLDDIRALRGGRRALRDYGSVDAVAARLRKTNPRLPADKAAWLARQWAAPRPGADGVQRWHILGDAAHRVVSARLSPAAEMQALYASITAPVMVVEAADSELPEGWRGRYSLAEFHERLQSVPRLQQRVLPDCGHMLHHDQPEALARLIEAFVNRGAGNGD
ncbi:MAG: alpha/beta hydrolase [Ottowia sp.]|nr:alpha/beta hydrolase [Ottowia sp.]